MNQLALRANQLQIDYSKHLPPEDQGKFEVAVLDARNSYVQGMIHEGSFRRILMEVRDMLEQDALKKREMDAIKKQMDAKRPAERVQTAGGL
jgi:hypothetical protein